MRHAIVLLAFLLAAQTAVAADAPDPVVKKQLDSLKLKYEVDKDNDFKLVFDVGGGRTQLAYIISKTETYGAMKIRQISSPGYKGEVELFPAKVANRLLEHSNSRKMGGWVKQHATAIFVVTLSANASAQELLDALKFAVNSADELEQEFTGKKDEF